MKRAVLPLMSVPLVALALAGAALGSAAAGPAPAANASASGSVDDFAFESYEADYYLDRASDGRSTLRTVETFVAEFPDIDQNRGIIRAIPDNYDGVPLNPRVESVVDENGSAVPSEEDSGDGFLELALGTDEYVRGDHTYTITYEQDNAVRHFDDTDSDEFYWDTTGVGFAQPFGSVTARVHVTDDLVPALTGNTACYVGAQGSSETCAVTEETAGQGDASGAVFSVTAGDVAPEQTVTVSIGFASGTFEIPEPPRPAPWAVVLPIVLMIVTGLVAIAATVSRILLGRGHRGRGIVVPQYSAPKDVNLMLGSDLVGRGRTAVAATLVSLAVRGNLALVDEGKDFSLRFIHSEGLDEQEVALLAAVYGDLPGAGETVRLDKAESERATRVKKVTDTSKTYAIQRGFRARPPWVAPVALLFVSIALFVLSLVLFICNIVLSPVVSLPGVLVLVTAIAGLAIGAACAVPARPLTASGADERDYLLGLRDYLALAEADRFRVLQSPDGAERVDTGDAGQIVKLYEKLLPWAVLWGVEKEWAGDLAVRYEATVEPSWYVGSGAFNAALFSSSVGRFSSVATTATAPVYVSSGSGSGSSSGGSFGGGFAGGGGGGGGGGGR